MNQPGVPIKAPLSYFPDVVEDGSYVMYDGAHKPGRSPGDWLRGNYPIMEFIDAGGRHIVKWRRGEDKDPESGHPHLVHAFLDIAMAYVLQRDRLGPDTRSLFRPQLIVPASVDEGWPPRRTAAERTSAFNRSHPPEGT